VQEGKERKSFRFRDLHISKFWHVRFPRDFWRGLQNATAPVASEELMATIRFADRDSSGSGLPPAS